MVDQIVKFRNWVSRIARNERVLSHFILWKENENDSVRSLGDKNDVCLVDAATCGCVGINFFNKFLFVSLMPVLRLRLNALSSHRSPKKSASTIKTASASTKRTTTIFIYADADADADADAENYGNQTNMTKDCCFVVLGLFKDSKF